MILSMLFSYLLNIVTDVVISISMNFKAFVIEWQNILSQICELAFVQIYIHKVLLD